MKTRILYRFKRTALLFLLAVLSVCMLTAQEHFIRFDTSDKSEVLDSVVVENMTQKLTVRMSGRDVLKLTDTIVGIPSLKEVPTGMLTIFPNPARNGRCSVTLQAPAEGSARVELVDVGGRLLHQSICSLQEGTNVLVFNRVPQGVNCLFITTSYKTYVGKLIGTEWGQGEIQVQQSFAGKTTVSATQVHRKAPAVIQNEVCLYHKPGDWIKVLGKSGENLSLLIFTPTCDDTLTFAFYACVDGDGNHYPTVGIGDRVWTAENLRTTRYNDSTSIPFVETQEQWEAIESDSGAYCWYDDDVQNKSTYGALYDGYAVVSGKLAPKGWHVATDNDFSSLFDTIQNQPNFLMENNPAVWDTLPQPPYNTSGFSAVGSGRRRYSSFSDMNESAFFWTSTRGEMPSSPPESLQKAPTASNYYMLYLYSTVITPWYTSFDGSSANYGLSVRCVRNTVPGIRTVRASGIKSVSAGVEGDLTTMGGESFVTAGFCWSSVHAEPTLLDSCTIDTLRETGTFTKRLVNLKPGTTYSIRAYAVNETGTSYGQTVTVVTTDTDTLRDVDGNEYPTVRIGNQTWMAENLRVTRLKDGTPIPLLADSAQWVNSVSPASCRYGNDTTTSLYGCLYNQYAVKTGKLAPEGWHVPAKTELDTLFANMVSQEGMENELAKRLKETGSQHWYEFLADGTDFGGFSALPGGYRSTNGSYLDQRYAGYWWTSTPYAETIPPTYLALCIGYQTYTSACVEQDGYSVRCLKDYPARLKTLLKDVRSTTASMGMLLVEPGGIASRSGICWSSAHPDPDTLNAQVKFFDPIEAQSGVWQECAGLTSGTTYYLRAFTVNSTGISYGETVTFHTQSNDSVTDADGNVYHTIRIGTQTWMVENLKSTKYRDGSNIAVVSGYHSETPGYSVYANTSSNKTTYGLLYNWYAVQTGKLAPQGWRVPSCTDWETLIAYLGGYEQAGGKLKESGLSHWASPNTNAVDWGFTALPGGSRDGASAYFMLKGSRGWWWSTTPGTETYNAVSMGLVSWMGDASMLQSYKSDALSVRCIKDE